jgi:hypothetical protein
MGGILPDGGQGLVFVCEPACTPSTDGGDANAGDAGNADAPLD